MKKKNREYTGSWKTVNKILDNENNKIKNIRYNHRYDNYSIRYIHIDCKQYKGKN